MIVEKAQRQKNLSQNPNWDYTNMIVHHKLFRILAIVCILLGINPIDIQADSYKDHYSFSFFSENNIGKEWQTDPQLEFQNKAFQATKNGEKLLAILHQPNNLYNTLRFRIRQRILLPKQDSRKAQMVVYASGINISRLHIKLSCVASDETIQRTAETHWNIDTTMNKITCEIDVSDAAMLDLCLYGEGLKDKAARVLLRPMDVLLDGVSIANAEVPTLPAVTMPQLYDAPKGLIPSQQLPPPPAIVAFGECVHGNSALRSAVYNNILNLIHQGKSRLILLEFPIERCLDINYYIHSDHYKLSQWVNPTYQILIDSIKQINKKRSIESKIEVVGIDLNDWSTPNENGLLDIVDFIISLPDWRTRTSIFPFLRALLSQQGKQALHFLRDNRATFDQSFSPLQIAIMERSLELYCQLPSIYNKVAYRDSVMAENVLWAAALCKSSYPIVFAHSNHVSKGSDYPNMFDFPMGYYLSRQQKFIYHPISFIFGTGTIGALYRGEFKSRIATPAPNHSFEHQLSKVALTSSYLNTDKGLNQIVQTRCVGLNHSDQNFYEANLYKRFSGLVFLKEVNGETPECTEAGLLTIYNRQIELRKEAATIINSYLKR